MARRSATTVDNDAVVAADRPHLLIHVDIDALTGGPGACHLDHGPALATTTACRLGCEGTMAVLVHDKAGNPLHLGPTTHGVNRSQRRALLARDKSCRFPGCTNRRYLHAHHVRHWADGGPTCISNLLLLCSRHHHAVHEGGFGVSGADGDVTFTRPDDTVIERPTAQATTGPSLPEQNQRLGLTITADTPGSRSNGGPYDRGLTSDVLWCLLHPDLILGNEPPEVADAVAEAVAA